jgi:tRNA nucleotidyltransferase (CCA-adding enzyme)
MGERTFDGRDVLAQLHDLPGGSRLIAAARAAGSAGLAAQSQSDPQSSQSRVFLVGGAVRDLLLGRTPRELDVLVEGDALAFARALAETWGNPVEHPQFGTAAVELDGVQIDVARARRERYPIPGALPEVEPASVGEDVLRRDFTVNTIAVMLDKQDATGEVEWHAAPGAFEDLRSGQLRVLHDTSFADDPTRLLRLARYSARLGFQIEPHTAALATQAVGERALHTVSGGRIGAELRFALSEANPVVALAAMDELGLLAAIHPRMRFDRAVLERSLQLLPGDGRADLLIVATLTLPMALRVGDDPRAEVGALLDRLQFQASDRDRVTSSAVAVARLIEELPTAERPSQLRAAVRGVPLEGVALAGAVHTPAEAPARRWLSELRHVRLQITGEDLLAAGVPEGPEIGRRLEAALDAKLDSGMDGSGLANDRDAELAIALEAVL